MSQSIRAGENNVQCETRPKQLSGDDVPAFHIGADFEIRQINRGACSRLNKIDVSTVTLKRANTSGDASWLNENRIADPQCSTGERPRHNSADSAQRERAVHEQSRFFDVAWKNRDC